MIDLSPLQLIFGLYGVCTLVSTWLAARLIGRRLVETREDPEAAPMWALPETQRRVGIAVLVLLLALLWPVTAGALVRDWREHPEA